MRSSPAFKKLCTNEERLPPIDLIINTMLSEINSGVQATLWENIRKNEEKESMKEYALETRFKGFNLKFRGKAFRLKKQDE